MLKFSLLRITFRINEEMLDYAHANQILPAFNYKAKLQVPRQIFPSPSGHGMPPENPTGFFGRRSSFCARPRQWAPLLSKTRPDVHARPVV